MIIFCKKKIKTRYRNYNIETGFGIPIDSSDNIYIRGFTSGGLNGNSNAGKEDVFIMKQ